MSYFLCLTKSMEKFPAGNNRNAAKGGEKSTRSVPSGRDELSARTCKKLPVASFCASERVFAVLFARRKKYQSVFLSGASRFSKPRFSSPKQQLPTDKIKSFRRLLAALFLLLSQQIFAASRLLSAAAPPFKLSFRKVCRGSANLESAHTDDSEPHKNSKNSY